jgi:Ca2+-transporting ATPase
MNSLKFIWHNLSIQETAQVFNIDLEKGLSLEQVKENQEKFGFNELPQKKPLSQGKIFLDQFKSILIYILIVSEIITLILKEWTDAIVIFFAIALSTVVGYMQERKASNALRELKKVLKIKAICIRNGKEKQVFQKDLVPGDIIILKAGDKVPADARIIKSSNLKINEAALTGEWITSKKHSKALEEDIPVADRENMLYMGTIVENGNAQAIVVQTGINTEIGKVAVMIRETVEEKTPYQKKLSNFSLIIGIIIIFICFCIFIEGIIKGKPFIEMFTTAVAVAVASIPEGLPVAMTVILALGMQRILKKKGLIRKLSAAETLGSTSIICTDKTLTLTQGKMQVDKIISNDEKFCYMISVLCNESFIENPDEPKKSWKLIGDPTSKGLILGAQAKGLYKPELEKEFPKIDKIQFDSQNKFIVTLHRSKKENLLFVSGAPEKILNLVSSIRMKNGQNKILDKIQKLKLERELIELTSRGLRVIAVAYKNTEIEKIRDKDIKNLTFVGFIGLKDPLRKDTKKAIDICKKAGIRTIIVTGDHVLTACAVAKELGLETGEENVILGKDLDKLSDKEFQERIDKICVYARVEPKHKLRIVSAWQDKDKVVAMTGDGINDAPALKRADIGIALGSATDVAIEVSDLVLLNDNFSVIVSAVEQGRAVLDNIRKVITYLLSDTFTEIIIISVTLFAGFPLPITAVQILWVNLIEDGFPSIALAFEPKEKGLMNQKPDGHDIPLLTREMKMIIFFIGIITDLILLGMFFWLWSNNHDITYVRTMIFAALSIDSIFYVFCCKSLRRNIWHINIFSNKYLIIAWLISFFALFATIYLPIFNTLLKTVPLGFYDWVILITLGLVELGLIETVKHYFIVRHQTNI